VVQAAGHAERPRGFAPRAPAILVRGSTISTSVSPASEYRAPARPFRSGHSMRRGFLDRPGCRLYYEADGTGPMLVFAHGLGGNHLSWWQQVPHFRDRYTCVTFSHRGFAPSSAPAGGPDPA